MSNMRVRAHYCLSLLLAVLAPERSNAQAQAKEAARGKPTPIIFSAPKSDTVSSNLNQMGGRTAPLTDLESSLQRPFKIFETERPANEYRPVNPFVAPAPALKNRRTKDLLERRAEDRYLLREDDETDPSKDDLPGFDDGPLSVSDKRAKTPLDRYYDNIDRLRLGRTNQPVRSLDLFAQKEQPAAQESPKERNLGGWFGRDLSTGGRTQDELGISAFSDNRPDSDRFKPRGFGSLFGAGPVPPGQATLTRTKDTRLEEFKRLIDGPGYGARGEFNALPPTVSAVGASQPSSPMGTVPAPIFSATPQPVGGALADTPGTAGAIGVPTGVPDITATTPSLTPTLPLQQTAPKPPVPKFSIPRGRF